MRAQPLLFGALTQRSPQLAVFAMGESTAMSIPNMPNGNIADTRDFASAFMVVVSQELIESVSDDAVLIGKMVDGAEPSVSWPSASKAQRNVNEPQRLLG